jgi:tagatose-6-phosphate ketose/aldose isomerase
MIMTILGIPQPELESAGGLWTAREIAQQPAVWAAIGDLVSREGVALRAFLGPLLARPDLRIILTGAGTSSFIGDCLAPALRRRTQRRVDAIATTDIVGAPASALEPALPTLVVSFARSGGSPESLAALEICERGLPDCHHLIVTCNAQGELYRRAAVLRAGHALLLPDETHDRGFAMTSSFTGMTLAAALAFDLSAELRPQALGAWAAQLLTQQLPLMAELARSGFERVVYLGSDAFRGLAREAALKLLELSDGRVVALADTPLGFRHGPKTVVNGRTLIVLFISNDPYIRRYELDLLRELRDDGVAARLVALHGAQATAGGPEILATESVAVPGAAQASDLALVFPYIAFAQSFAFLQSLALGVRPDTPNARGVVSRVVQGVTLHPWSPP